MLETPFAFTIDEIPYVVVPPRYVTYPEYMIYPPTVIAGHVTDNSVPLVLLRRNVTFGDPVTLITPEPVNRIVNPAEVVFAGISPLPTMVDPVYQENSAAVLDVDVLDEVCTHLHNEGICPFLAEMLLVNVPEAAEMEPRAVKLPTLVKEAATCHAPPDPTVYHLY